LRTILKFILITLLLLLPVVLITNLGVIQPSYYHIIINQIYNTVIIVLSVCFITTIVGVTLSWVFAIYDFPFKNSLEKIIILGMVFPSYVLAFFYSEMFNIFGSIALIGTLVVTTLPYVFMMVTTSIRIQSQRMVESALMFGKDKRWIKGKLILPLIFPTIVLSTLLVMGDTFSEFGATYFYGVNTVMTGIYEIWFGLNESIQGIRLSAWLLTVVIMVYLVINVLKKVFVDKSDNFINSREFKGIVVENIGIKGWFITFLIFLLTIITFFIPCFVLLTWVIESYNKTDWFKVLATTINSGILASIISLSVLCVTTIILYLFKHRLVAIMTICNTLYSIPGIVLAITTIFISTHLPLSFTPVIFLYVLIVKYIAIGVDNISAPIQKIHKQHYHSSKLLGHSSLWYIKNVQFPLGFQIYLVAGLLVWIDVIRELVIGLTIRPQGLNLLSIEIFRFMDLEQLSMSGPWILSMVILTMVPIYFINMVLKQNR
jgi:iron(III) transport system permease protein